MTYVIVGLCRDSKDLSCVEVCPVDCIHPAPGEPGHEQAEMLYIDPVECIDCGACAEACPVEACIADYDLTEEWDGYAELNASEAAKVKRASAGP